MITTYQIFTKSKHLKPKDWLTLQASLKSFVSSFTLYTVIKNQNLIFYLTTPTDISASLSNHPNFFFKKTNRSTLPIIQKSLKLKINLPNHNLFDLISTSQIKKSLRFHSLIITYHKYPLPFYITTLSFTNPNHQLITTHYLSFKPPFHLLDLNFNINHTFTLKTLPNFTNPPTIKSLLTSSLTHAIAQVDLFPYDLNPYYLPITNLDLTKHSLVVGQTGTGKSKFLQLLISKLLETNPLSFHLILIDPHLKLAQAIKKYFPHKTQLIDYLTTSTSLFPTSTTPQTATELTLLLFKTLIKDQFNPYLQRLLRYTLFVLYTTSSISLTNLLRFLTQEDYKNQTLNRLPSKYDHLKHFFDTDFNRYQTAFYDTTFMPIISLIEELNFLPTLDSTSPASLVDLINSTPCLLFALDQLKLGSTNTKLISGLLVQQIFLLSQANKLNHPTLLIIDEAPLIENAAFATILSQSRKFNLSMILSYQYLNQAQPDLTNSLKTNIYNYFIFKTSDTDAKLLNNLIQLKINTSNQNPLHQDRLQTKLITSLNPRHFIARIFYNHKFYPAFKAKTLTI